MAIALIGLEESVKFMNKDKIKSKEWRMFSK